MCHNLAYFLFGMPRPMYFVRKSYNHKGSTKLKANLIVPFPLEHSNLAFEI